MVIGDETAVYHVMSRTALDGFPLGDIEFYGDDGAFAEGRLPYWRENYPIFLN